MTDYQQAAQHLATAIARLRLAERDARHALERVALANDALRDARHAVALTRLQLQS